MALVWALLRARHPLLASEVVKTNGEWSFRSVLSSAVLFRPLAGGLSPRLRIKADLDLSPVTTCRYDPPANASEAINEAFDALSCPRDNLTGQGPSYLSVCLRPGPVSFKLTSVSTLPSISPDLIDSYLNGPRLLSPSRLSFLVVSRATSTEASGQAEFDLLLCTTHFVGDGIALHTFANELYGLIANGGSEMELRQMLEDEIQGRSVSRSS